MAATYTDTLPTDKDWVRFLIGDTDTASPLFTDEEIGAAITEQVVAGAAVKYLAAAMCLATLLIKWSSKGKGVSSKSVSKLKLTKGVGSSDVEALSNRIDELRRRGAKLSTPSPAMFRVIRR